MYTQNFFLSQQFLFCVRSCIQPYRIRGKKKTKKDHHINNRTMKKIRLYTDLHTFTHTKSRLEKMQNKRGKNLKKKKLAYFPSYTNKYTYTHIQVQCDVMQTIL